MTSERPSDGLEYSDRVPPPGNPLDYHMLSLKTQVYWAVKGHFSGIGYQMRACIVTKASQCNGSPRRAE
ncbi:hypothetical protein GQ53DRAFT_291922 [Thozetella sp. PMI_491]|nr:hypothetical protein GQ53DRAFT_291922 [Thozetella sp. PMI_491]